MRATNFVAVLFVSVSFLWRPVLSQCPELTKPVLTNQTLEQANNEAPEGIQYDSVVIHAFNINCLAAASTRGYREATATVNFTTNTGLTQTFQLALFCNPSQEWLSSQRVTLPRDVDGMTLTAEEALNYETDVNCSSCHPLHGNPNHPSFCRACLVQCDVGLMACYNDYQDLVQKCCNFYDAEDNCLEECADNQEPDSNYTCVCTGSVEPSGKCSSVSTGVKECTIQSPLTVIPYRTPGNNGISYNYHGTCEHILTAPCDSQAYKVVGDFSQTDQSIRQVGLVLPGYTAIIDEELKLIEEGEKPGEVTTAQQLGDYVSITFSQESNVVLSIVRTNNQTVVTSEVGPSDLCGLCGNQNGSLNSSSGEEVKDIMDRMQIETFASSWKVEPSEQSLEHRRECAVIRSDTLIGDPLLQVPLWMKDSDEIRSLCYEVHGRSDAFFNLVSDECVIVNALYSQVDDLNVVSEIGVRAVTSKKQDCIAVKVEQVNESCATTLRFDDGSDVLLSVGETYSQDGIEVRQQNQYRVRISVPNCEQVDLVMWATCEVNEGMPAMMHFNISRGVNLRSTSHGLLGQFWNIPVTAEKVNDPALLQDLPQEYFNRNKIYMVTIQPASSPERTFFGELFDRHWDNYKSPCMYVGNSQGGPSGEMYGLDDPVIEGVYTDYIVSGIFDNDFPHMKFDDGKCSS